MSAIASSGNESIIKCDWRVMPFALKEIWKAHYIK